MPHGARGEQRQKCPQHNRQYPYLPDFGDLDQWIRDSEGEFVRVGYRRLNGSRERREAGVDVGAGAQCNKDEAEFETGEDGVVAGWSDPAPFGVSVTRAIRYESR